MQQFTREEDDLILPRHDRLVTTLADVSAFFPSRVVNPQFTAFELSRLTMEEIDKCQVSCGYSIAAVIAVEVEEVPVVAGGDLGFYVGDGKFLHAELVQNLWQYSLDACQHYTPMMSEVHEDAGTPVFVVDDAAIRTGRDNLTGAEVIFMRNREASKFLKFLRCEELVENHALCRQDGRPLSNRCRGF